MFRYCLSFASHEHLHRFRGVYSFIKRKIAQDWPECLVNVVQGLELLADGLMRRWALRPCFPLARRRAIFSEATSSARLEGAAQARLRFHTARVRATLVEKETNRAPPSAVPRIDHVPFAQCGAVSHDVHDVFVFLELYLVFEFVVYESGKADDR